MHKEIIIGSKQINIDFSIINFVIHTPKAAPKTKKKTIKQ